MCGVLLDFPYESLFKTINNRSARGLDKDIFTTRLASTGISGNNLLIRVQSSLLLFICCNDKGIVKSPTSCKIISSDTVLCTIYSRWDNGNGVKEGQINVWPVCYVKWVIGNWWFRRDFLFQTAVNWSFSPISIKKWWRRRVKLLRLPLVSLNAF